MRRRCEARAVGGARSVPAVAQENLRPDVEFVHVNDPDGGPEAYREVAALASRALVTLGPHGGQMLNVAFMQPGTAVVEVQ